MTIKTKNKMKKTVLILIVGFFYVNGYAQNEIRKVQDFSSLKISNAFKVILTQGDKNEIKIEAPKEEYLEKIITEVANDKLILAIKGKIKIKGTIKVYITYKNLKEINLSGASELTTTNTIKADQFYLDGSGASEMVLKIDVKKLKLDFSGASEIMLSGSAIKFDVDLSGASDLKAAGLKVEKASVNISGAASVKMNVSKEVTGKASGAASVHVKGGGVINIQKSGASSISRG